jgi:hypothetical protein
LREFSNLITSIIARKPLHFMRSGMYRIELSPGEETVFRSIEELAVAIKRGVVTSRARIYHNATSKWLPIQVHPHYKAAVSMPLTQAELVAGPPVKPLSTLRLKDEVEPEPPLSMAAVPPAQADAPTPRKKARAEQPRPGKRNRRPTKPRRQLRIALIGALLVGGAQWVLSAPLFSHQETPKLITVQRHLITGPTAAMKRVSSPNSAAMVPVLPSPSSGSAAPLEELDNPNVGVSAPSFGGAASGVESAVAPAIERAPSGGNETVARAPLDSAKAEPVDSTNRKPITPKR